MGQECRRGLGVFTLMLVGGSIVNKFNQVGEVEGGGVGFVAFYSITGRESELKRAFAVGGECETMIHVHESHQHINRQRGQ